MTAQLLSLEDCQVEILAEVCDIDVHDNAICSGDDAFDRKVEAEIIERLNQGDIWAWATVEVRVSWAGLSASTWIGGVCVDNEAEFRAGILPDIAPEALDLLNAKLDQSGEH